MVNVTHDDNNGVSRHEVALIVNAVVDDPVLNCDDNLFLDLCAELLGDDGGGVVVKHFVDRDHLTEREELLDDLCCSHFEHCGKLAHGDFLGELEVHLRLLCSLGGDPLESLGLGLAP